MNRRQWLTSFGLYFSGGGGEAEIVERRIISDNRKSNIELVEIDLMISNRFSEKENHY